MLNECTLRSADHCSWWVCLVLRYGAPPCVGPGLCNVFWQIPAAEQLFALSGSEAGCAGPTTVRPPHVQARTVSDMCSNLLACYLLRYEIGFPAVADSTLLCCTLQVICVLGTERMMVYRVNVAVLSLDRLVRYRQGQIHQFQPRRSSVQCGWRLRAVSQAGVTS